MSTESTEVCLLRAIQSSMQDFIDAGGGGGGGGGTGANPTAQVILTPVNGVATTFMRSDGAPALSQAIAPTWTARHIFGVNGLVNAPAVTLTGTPFTGGTTTTTKPLLLIEPAGTTSTGWGTTGTMLGINAAAAFAGNLIDAQKNGVNMFKVNSLGDISFSQFTHSFETVNSASFLIKIATSGVVRVLASAGYPTLMLADGISFGAGSPVGSTFDASLWRLGAGNIRHGGPPSATPLAQTLTIGEASRPGTDSNVAGAHGTIQSGLGTGTGTASNLIFQTPTLAAGGSGVQTYATRLSLSVGAVTIHENINFLGTFFSFSAKSKIFSPSDGIIELTNAATTDFSRLQFGGTTNAFPALRRDLASLTCVLADGSNFADFRARNVTVDSTLFLLTPTTPASATAAGTLGQIAWDTGFIYVCTAVNTWKRAAIATW